MKSLYDVIIIGAGAAGLMCAIQAGTRGKRVSLLDHAQKLGEKIRISGGGRCNFTNLHTNPSNFISNNPHFCKSALKQYTYRDFIALLDKHGLSFHEKKLGQLFCDQKAPAIIEMLENECAQTGVELKLNTAIKEVDYNESQYIVTTNDGQKMAKSLVIATGGLSIPKIGATKFGFDIAKKFQLKTVKTAPALVPLTFQAELLERCKSLSGVSVEASVSCGKTSFSEGLLFTHRGLSGPSILQISSYWQEGDDITIDLAPGTNMRETLKAEKQNTPKQEIQNILSTYLPKRLALDICAHTATTGRIADLSDKKLATLAQAINHWTIKPAGTEGYRTAEVTRGGVDTDELSSKTMEVKKQPGLYFIGEVVDVTGHLGGFNFQWAWSSGYVAGQNV